MKKLFSLSFTKLAALSACIVLVANISLGAIADFRIDSALKNGKMISAELTVEDFELEGMVERKKDGVVRYVATDSDPQMYYVVDGLFTNMTFTMENTMPDTEIVVYYTTEEGQGFSEKQRLWAQPVKGGENLYIIEMPVQFVHTLRIDPTVSGGSFMTFGSFRMNSPSAMMSDGIIDITVRDIPVLVLYTALLASIIRFVQDFFTKKSD